MHKEKIAALMNNQYFQEYVTSLRFVPSIPGQFQDSFKAGLTARASQPPKDSHKTRPGAGKYFHSYLPNTNAVLHTNNSHICEQDKTLNQKAESLSKTLVHMKNMKNYRKNLLESFMLRKFYNENFSCSTSLFDYNSAFTINVSFSHTNIKRNSI